ncbi:MAG: hypothetical protein WA789_06050 [Candidatus Acidiferrum sp.]
MNQQNTATVDRSTGASSPSELFVLTDEQILEIEPEAQDAEVRSASASSPAASFSQAQDDPGTHQQNPQASPRTYSDPPTEHGSRSTSDAEHPAATLPAQPPAWLAETMNDPQRGAEARALWEGAQRAEKEAASYREVFAKPEEARAAADRARMLDDIDRAYFAGDATQRAQLAAMMMREDPASFRDMVFEGLRALEEAGKPIRNKSIADVVGRSAAATPAGGASPAPATQASNRPQQRDDAAQQAQLAAYASFEKAANEDLERSVGSAIERTLAQALPSLTSAGGVSNAGAQHAAPLQTRLAAAIRQDVEKALQGDRQLGEQVAQILSAKRLDNETRALIVRLIGERAQQLVPGATKRALNDWTQTTLAAHRGKSARDDTAFARREVTPVAPASRVPQEQSAQRKDATHQARTEGREPAKGRLNYGKLSDEQILDL